VASLVRLGYENLLAALLGFIGIGAFLELGSLVVPVASSFLLALLGLYIVFCALFAIKSAYRERSREQFDLTAPTLFDNGVIVLRSRAERCAAFFAFALQCNTISTERVRRTLTTLLKILPHSSVLSIETAMQNECFANFYVKFEKTDILQRTRELIGSASSGFRALFGRNNVRALCDDELLRHLALGAQGRIQRVGRFGRHTAFLKTDTGRFWLSAAVAADAQPSLLRSIKRESNGNGKTYRAIFAVKCEQEQRVALSSRIIVVATNRSPHSDGLLLRSRLPAVRRMRACEIVHKLGDMMTRNIVADDEAHQSFEKGVDQLLSFLALWSNRQSDTESGMSCDQTVQSAITDPRAWRTGLAATAKKLRLVFETDVLVWSNGLPLRLDARVGSTLFKIVSSRDRVRLEWLLDRLSLAMVSETWTLALLLSSASDASALTEILIDMPVRERIRSLTSVDQLKTLLLERKTTSETATESPAEAVQKIL